MEKIIQITPAAEGWRALYVNREDGEVAVHTTPLLGWALVEWPAEGGDAPIRSVEGLDGTAGWVELCREAGNFVRYLAPDESEEAMLDEASEHLRRREKEWRRKWSA